MSASTNENYNPPALAPPPPVTQRDLAELQRGREAARQTECLRKSILSRLQSGATIEPGPYSAQIKEVSSRRINRQSLEQLWGKEYVDGLRLVIPETVSTQLIIGSDFEIAFIHGYE